LKKITTRCDIFCNVIDNYGDIGVCWRLARQLANEHGIAVRLWVDDLNSFAKLCPDADAALEKQKCRGVEVCHWSKDFPEAQLADLVIEAFACKLPQSYLEAMAAQRSQPIWINLEYLSAEDWVEGCHKLPSPHPSLPLTRYLFLSGFHQADRRFAVGARSAGAARCIPERYSPTACLLAVHRSGYTVSEDAEDIAVRI